MNNYYIQMWKDDYKTFARTEHIYVYIHIYIYILKNRALKKRQKNILPMT